MEDYVFPSVRRAEKYPRISIEADGGANEYIKWLNEHKEIDRRVPPVFSDFTIAHRMGNHKYLVIVHYFDGWTRYAFKARMDSDVLMTASVDYERINDVVVGVDCQASASAVNRFGEEWVKNAAIATALLVIGVQAYLLYFKPEITEKIYAPSEIKATEEKLHAAKKKHRRNAEPIKIRKSKVKLIYLTDHDRPPRNINYRKLAWHVRGHYRRVGKDKKLKFIAPFTCHRGGTNPGKRRYILL
jgi:hypothetical protein